MMPGFSQNPYERDAVMAMQRGDCMPHEVQMAFERADLQCQQGIQIEIQKGEKFFERNWAQHSKHFRLHTLGSFGTFRWDGFRVRARSNDY
jgi:hypothetical protein